MSGQEEDFLALAACHKETHRDLPTAVVRDLLCILYRNCQGLCVALMHGRLQLVAGNCNLRSRIALIAQLQSQFQSSSGRRMSITAMIAFGRLSNAYLPIIKPLHCAQRLAIDAIRRVAQAWKLRAAHQACVGALLLPNLAFQEVFIRLEVMFCL